MKYDSSQQVSATYLRNNASEVIDEAIKEGIRVIVRRSKPVVVMLPVQEYENLKNPPTPPAKQKPRKKFNLEELRKNSTFSKYRGCMKDMYPEGMTSVQLQKQWAKYVD